MVGVNPIGRAADSAWLSLHLSRPYRVIQSVLRDDLCGVTLAVLQRMSRVLLWICILPS